MHAVVTPLTGSEGKLTVTVQRLGVLEGAGNLSHCTVAGTQTVQSLCGVVVEYFISVLQQEG